LSASMSSIACIEYRLRPHAERNARPLSWYGISPVFK
jgi:hypothetical protein